jgi:hypothetical protein
MFSYPKRQIVVGRPLTGKLDHSFAVFNLEADQATKRAQYLERLALELLQDHFFFLWFFTQLGLQLVDAQITFSAVFLTAGLFFRLFGGEKLLAILVRLFTLSFQLWLQLANGPPRKKRMLAISA